MFSFRDLILFLAGAEFFHTISHAILPYFITLPIDLKFMVLTSNMNMYVITINAIITLLLLWWSHKLK